MVADWSLFIVPSPHIPIGFLGRSRQVEAMSQDRVGTQGLCPAPKCAEQEYKMGWMQCKKVFSSLLDLPPASWHCSELHPALHSLMSQAPTAATVPAVMPAALI